MTDPPQTIPPPERLGVTAEAFDAFVELPENANLLFEYIDGEVVEVASNPFSSWLASEISFAINLFLQDHPLGYVTGEAGGYKVLGQRYLPDVAFISARKGSVNMTGYNETPPNFVVEVVSPSDKALNLASKVRTYREAGIHVWVVYWWPDDEVEGKLKDIEVHDYAPGQPVQIIGVDGVLEHVPALPGFTLALESIIVKSKRLVGRE